MENAKKKRNISPWGLVAQVAFAFTWGISAEPSGQVIPSLGKALPEVQSIGFWLVLDILKVWPQHK